MMKKLLVYILVILSVPDARMRAAVVSLELPMPSLMEAAPDALSRTSMPVASQRKDIDFVPIFLSNSPSIRMAAVVEETTAEDAAEPQTSPSGTQIPAAPRKHHLRNLLIIVVLGAVLLIALAAAAKK